MRFGAEVQHITMRTVCSERTRLGLPCSSWTHYICIRCRQGLCGRHQNKHHCYEQAPKT